MSGILPTAYDLRCEIAVVRTLVDELERTMTEGSGNRSTAQLAEELVRLAEKLNQLAEDPPSMTRVA